MKNKNNDGERGQALFTSFRAGVIALVFLLLGFQLALFVHKAAETRILANRDRPDTVYVVGDASILPASGSATVAGSGAYHSGSATVAGSGAYHSGSAIGAASNAPHSSSATGLGSGAPGAGSGAHGAGSGAPHSSSGGYRGRTTSVVRHNSSHNPKVESIRESRPPRRVENFRFNPNTVSIEDLVRLGFSPKQAESIDNYRQKGGRFRRKTDFQNSFVVSDSIYRRLEAYIVIPLVDINKADSTAFDALPGIGPYFASKMVSYREQLKGYSCKEQLMEIYHFDREKFDALKDLICVSEAEPYPLWTLPEDSLRLHPHIRDWRTAHSIVFYRDNNDPSQWTVDGLEEAGILDAQRAARLRLCRISR